MNTQNTPVHINLWHHDFWRMAIANFLLAMSVTIFIPVFPQWLIETQQMTFSQTGLVFGAFAVGLFFLGCFTSFLVQHYRRNMVCIWALLCLAASLGLLYYIDETTPDNSFAWLTVQRFLFGATFGLAQMVLASTLVIDTCESFQRTEANHSATWFSRFSLSLGPLVALLLYPSVGFRTLVLVAIGCALAALILISLVHFPFRAPEDHIRLVSTDRFFLPHGTYLFVNLLMITIATGLLLSLPHDIRFYAMMMVGFLLAILAQRFVFRQAELKSEVVSGLVLMGSAVLLLLTRSQNVVSYIAPLFVGFALGIIGSRFLLFFIKLSRHCQRGTSQSSYMLGWESGLALGIAMGYGICEQEPRQVLLASLGFIVVALLFYQFTHNWFLTHKNR